MCNRWFHLALLLEGTLKRREQKQINVKLLQDQAGIEYKHKEEIDITESREPCRLIGRESIFCVYVYDKNKNMFGQMRDNSDKKKTRK